MFVHSVRCQGLFFYIFSFADGFISAQFSYKQLTPPELKSFSTHFSVYPFPRFLLLPVGIMGAIPRLRSGTGAFPRFSVSPFPSSFTGRLDGRSHRASSAFSHSHPLIFPSSDSQLSVLSSKLSTFLLPIFRLSTLSSQFSTLNFFPKIRLHIQEKDRNHSRDHAKHHIDEEIFVPDNIL